MELSADQLAARASSLAQDDETKWVFGNKLVVENIQLMCDLARRFGVQVSVDIDTTMMGDWPYSISIRVVLPVDSPVSEFKGKDFWSVSPLIGGCERRLGDRTPPDEYEFIYRPGWARG